MDRGRVLWGLALLAVGGVLLAGQAGLVDAREVLSTWWPLLVVAGGLLKLVDRPRDVGGALAVIGVGLVLLAWRLDLVGAALLPLVLIGAGVVVLLRTPHAEAVRAEDPTTDLIAVFGGRDTNVVSPVYHGGRAVAVFGGVVLDLRQTSLPPEGADLQVVTVLGDVELTLPMGWNVQVTGPTVLGDLDDRSLGAPADAPTLRVHVTVVLGDVTLRTDALTRARTTAA